MAELKKDTPSAVVADLGAIVEGQEANQHSTNYHPPQEPRKRVSVKAGLPHRQPFTESGQVAKVLLALVHAGEAGITPLARETWSLRLSDHVRKLKNRYGLVIVALWGRHEDGRHARYVLRSTVTIIEIISD